MLSVAPRPESRVSDANAAKVVGSSCSSDEKRLRETLAHMRAVLAEAAMLRARRGGECEMRAGRS